MHFTQLPRKAAFSGKSHVNATFAALICVWRWAAERVPASAALFMKVKLFFERLPFRDAKDAIRVFDSVLKREITGIKCCLPFFVVMCCSLLLSVVLCWCMLLLLAVCCSLLSFVVLWRRLLFFVVVCCSLLSCVVLYWCMLLLLFGVH